MLISPDINPSVQELATLAIENHITDACVTVIWRMIELRAEIKVSVGVHVFTTERELLGSQIEQAEREVASALRHALEIASAQNGQLTFERLAPGDKYPLPENGVTTHRVNYRIGVS